MAVSKRLFVTEITVKALQEPTVRNEPRVSQWWGRWYEWPPTDRSLQPSATPLVYRMATSSVSASSRSLRCNQSINQSIGICTQSGPK